MATSIIKKNIGTVSTSSTSTYEKSPDGTLIQWGRASATTNSSTGNGYLPYGGDVTITFPVPFVGDLPILMATPLESAGYWNGGTRGTAPTLTQAVVGIGGDQNNATKTVCWMAIGRWK